MATEVFSISAEKRSLSTKGATKTLRRNGKVPGIIYGAVKPEQTIMIEEKEFTTVVQKGRYRSRLLDIKVGGEIIRVLPRAVQRNRVTEVPEHADFQRIQPGKHIKVMVPVVIENRDKSPGIKRGAVLNIVRHEIEVTCPPEKIPGQITVDLTGLNIGDSVHIENITLDPAVKPTIQRNFTVATIVGRKAKDDEIETTAAIAVAPETAEGEAAAAGASAADAPAAGGEATAAGTPAAKAEKGKEKGKKE